MGSKSGGVVYESLWFLQMSPRFSKLMFLLAIINDLQAKGPSRLKPQGSEMEPGRLPIPLISATHSGAFRPPRRSGATLGLKDFLPNDQAESSFKFFLTEPPFKLMR
jgi:hypothetical protein